MNTSSETMNVNYANLARSQSPQRRLLIKQNYTPKWTHQDNNTNGPIWQHLLPWPFALRVSKLPFTWVFVCKCVNVHEYPHPPLFKWSLPFWPVTLSINLSKYSIIMTANVTRDRVITQGCGAHFCPTDPYLCTFALSHSSRIPL